MKRSFQRTENFTIDGKNGNLGIFDMHPHGFSGFFPDALLQLMDPHLELLCVFLQFFPLCTDPGLFHGIQRKNERKLDPRINLPHAFFFQGICKRSAGRVHCRCHSGSIQLSFFRLLLQHKTRRRLPEQVFFCGEQHGTGIFPCDIVIAVDAFQRI